MPHVSICRYTNPTAVGYLGCISVGPWAIFIDLSGQLKAYDVSC